MSADTAAFSHITLGTNDYECATAFYDDVLAVLGFSRLSKPPGKAPVYAKGGKLPYVYLMKPFDGRPATWGNGTHVAFLAASRDEVDAFFHAAMSRGGMDEGPPGPRPHYSDDYYAAYVRDPDGNKLQAVCFSAD